ncbi:MAG: cyclic nucleotide-binding domain-containing protein [Spirochaetes bacterium]|nr:cyclic nucleotide-binding domain-containing protein [Spirochaetota bacterium]
MARRVLYYKHNERIISAGESEKRMYIILEGKVEITLTNGSQKLNVAVLGKGDFFGEISIFSNRPRSANVSAIGDVKLAFIDDFQQLKSFLIRNPNFAAKMVHVLAERLAETDEILLGKINELHRIKLIRDI